MNIKKIHIHIQRDKHIPKESVIRNLSNLKNGKSQSHPDAQIILFKLMEV